jgi:hypothetical protein
MAGEIGNLTTLFVNGTGLGDVVGNVEWANGLTTALGYAGIATSLVNLSSQALKSNKTQNDILGMYKSTAYLLGSISQSATLGTIGASVWVVDKGLTEMGEYSYNKIAEDTTKAYRHYYSKYMARSKSDWRWALKDVARNAAKNKERADTAIMDEIDRWCGLFWEIDTKTFTDILVDVGQQGRGWPDADTKKAITSDYKGDLLKMLEPILEEVQRDLELDLWREQQKRIEEFRVKLNTAVTFEIKDTLKEGQKESAFRDYTAAFGPLSNGAVKADWQFSVNKEGWIRVQSTVIGWMLAGQPKELRLYEPGKDPELDAPDKTILFKMSVPHVLISLKTEEEIVSLGKWSIDGAPEGYPLYGIYVKGDRIADGVMVDEAMARQIFDMGGGRTFTIEEGTGDFLIPTEWRHTASDTVKKDVFRIHFVDEYHLVTSYQSGADGATMTKVSD